MFKNLKLSRNQVDFITRIHDIFARLTASGLSSLLRSSVHVQVISVKQMTYKNYIRLIPAHAALAIINMGGSMGYTILEIDPMLTFSIIDRLCGGTGEKIKTPHELTDIETSLIEGIIVRIVKNMHPAWNMAANSKPSLQQIDTNLMYFQKVNPTDRVIIVKLETVVNDVKGSINICIPCFTAELLLDRPSVENDKPADKEDVHADLANEIKELKDKYLELKNELNSKVSLEKACEPAQDQKNDAQEIDIIESLSSDIKKDVENAAKLISDYLEHDERSKAAFFLITIGTELSIEIYKHLREDEIETLTFDISRLGRIEYKDKVAVLKEFHESLKTIGKDSFGGIDYARVLLEGHFGSQKTIDIISRLTSSLQVRPFDFIRRVDPDHLINLIRQEHPQIIALVLAYLKLSTAAIILQNHLPEEIKSDVARRIAVMDKVSPEVLREIERVLEKNLSTLSCEDYTSAGGVYGIADMLNRVNRSSEKQILEALEAEYPKLAEEIKYRMFEFEDIVLLDDRAVQMVMREVDSQELAKALKSVDSEVQDKIFRNMSKNAATMLKEDMEYMGPIRLTDVEKEQKKIVSIIRRLEDSGEIIIARAGEDELDV